MKLPFSKTRIVILTGYQGHGKRRGIIRFANGFTLRWGKLAAHIWQVA